MLLRIKALRQAAGLTQEQLAEKARIPQGTVSKIESGRCMPRLDSVQKIAVALNVSVGELCDQEAG